MGGRGCPSLPGISWRGTCAKLKPLPAQASRTSLQFRALKSALDATKSREKVQMIVSSLSIVHHYQDPFSFFLFLVGRGALLCSIPLVGKTPPAVDPLLDE